MNTNSTDASEKAAPGHRRRVGAARPRNHEAPPSNAISLRIDNACKLSGLGRTTIYGLIRAGELRAMKAGGRTLICAASLRDYLAGLPTLPAKAG